MRKVIMAASLLAVSVCFGQAFSSQVTKKYCDANMNRAVTNAAAITRQLVPGLVTEQVPEAVTNFMKEAGIPEVKTNVVIIEHFDTNYITTVTNSYTIDNRFTDRIVGTNATVVSDIKAIARLYSETVAKTTVITQNSYYAQASYNAAIQFKTNFLYLGKSTTFGDNFAYRYSLEPLVGSDKFYYLCSDATLGENNMRVRCNIVPEFCITPSSYWMGRKISTTRVCLKVIDGYIGITGGVTNYVTATTFPALGQYIVINSTWGDYDDPESWTDIWTTFQGGTGSVSRYYPFDSYDNQIDGYLLTESGTRVPSGNFVWNKMIDSRTHEVTNYVTTTRQLATYNDAVDVMSKVDASIIVTNPVFIAELDRQLAKYDNMGKTNVALSAMYATNSANSANAAANSASSALSSKNSAATSESNALSYKNSASSSASSASSSASSASSYASQASSSASSAASSASQANTTIRNILNDTTEILISQTRLDGSLYHLDGVPTDGSGVVNQYAWMNLSDLTVHYPSKFQYTIHAKASGGLYNYTKAIPFTGFKAVGHSALPYYDMGTYKSGETTVELTLFMSNHYWVVRESLSNGTNSGSRDWKSSGSYYGPDNWTTIPSFTAGSWVGYSSWGNLAMSELSVSGVAVNNINYYAAVSAFDGGVNKDVINGLIDDKLDEAFDLIDDKLDEAFDLYSYIGTDGTKYNNIQFSVTRSCYYAKTNCTVQLQVVKNGNSPTTGTATLTCLGVLPKDNYGMAIKWGAGQVFSLNWQTTVSPPNYWNWFYIDDIFWANGKLYVEMHSFSVSNNYWIKSRWSRAASDFPKSATTWNLTKEWSDRTGVLPDYVKISVTSYDATMYNAGQLASKRYVDDTVSSARTALQTSINTLDSRVTTAEGTLSTLNTTVANNKTEATTGINNSFAYTTSVSNKLEQKITDATTGITQVDSSKQIVKFLGYQFNLILGSITHGRINVDIENPTLISSSGGTKCYSYPFTWTKTYSSSAASVVHVWKYVPSSGTPYVHILLGDNYYFQVNSTSSDTWTLFTGTNISSANSNYKISTGIVGDKMILKMEDYSIYQPTSGSYWYFYMPKVGIYGREGKVSTVITQIEYNNMSNWVERTFQKK